MSIIELKITLEDIEPAVKRTLQVPTNIRLDRLHLIIQAAMGWTNSHLYCFTVGDTTWGVPDPDYVNKDLRADKATLAKLIEATSTRTIEYLYDFGDCWEHTIKIGKVLEPIPGEVYPRLTDVVGRCPPEDVGGYPGYEAFLEIIDDPGHPEHDDLIDWSGGDFDPDAPDSEGLRLLVHKLAKGSRPKEKRAV